MLTKVSSARIQVAYSQWRMLDDGYQRMELCSANLLHPNVLPGRLWILCRPRRRTSSPYYTSPDRQQYLFWTYRPLGGAVQRVHPLRVGLLGHWPGPFFDAR